ARAEANIESLENLESNLAEMGRNLADVPFVLQYNKRDLPDVMPIEELEADLNRIDATTCEASALRGDGVFETLKLLSKKVLVRLATGAPPASPETDRAT